MEKEGEEWRREGEETRREGVKKERERKEWRRSDGRGEIGHQGGRESTRKGGSVSYTCDMIQVDFKFVTGIPCGISMIKYSATNDRNND